MAESVDIKLLGVNNNGRIVLKYQPLEKTGEKEAIIQAIINDLMTTPGRDAFNQSRGGGLLSLLRSTRSVESVVNELSAIISDIKDDVLSDQAQTLSSVKVTDITISDVTYDKTLGIYFTLTVVFDDGEEETIKF